MNVREITRIGFLFLLYLTLQILIVRNLVIFDYGFCFVYVACILLLPNEVNQTTLLLLAFVTGIIVDTFYNTLGMHAAATVLMAYIRPLVVRVQMGQRILESRVIFTLQELGFSDFFKYIIVLVLLHHSVLFLIEAGSLSLLLPTLIRAVASALFTTLSITLIQFFTRN
jgi:rod shape-determining protein MreD